MFSYLVLRYNFSVDVFRVFGNFFFETKIFIWVNFCVRFDQVYATDPKIPEKIAKLEEVEIVEAPPSEDHQKWAEAMFLVRLVEGDRQFE